MNVLTAADPEIGVAVHDDLFADLPVPVQQAVARGDVTLEAILERITAPSTQELCPRCAVRNVSPRYDRLGLCAVCARRAMTEAFMELISELEAARDASRLKKTVQRLRDEQDPDRPRRPNKHTAKGETPR